MARPERNARHDDRNPFIDPFFIAHPVPGYSHPDAIDPTGYALSDLELPGRLADASRGYGPAIGVVGATDCDPPDSLPPGSVARRADLGMRDDGYGPDRLAAADFVTAHHAQAGAPLEYQGSWIGPPFVVSQVAAADVPPIYHGDGYPEPTFPHDTHAAGAFGPVARSQAGKPLDRNPLNVDDYGDSRSPVGATGWRRSDSGRGTRTYPSHTDGVDDI